MSGLINTPFRYLRCLGLVILLLLAFVLILGLAQSLFTQKPTDRQIIELYFGDNANAKYEEYPAIEITCPQFLEPMISPFCYQAIDVIMKVRCLIDFYILHF